MAGPGPVGGVAGAEVPEEERLFLRQHPLLSLAEPGKVGLELAGWGWVWGRPRRGAVGGTGGASPRGS